MTERLLDCRDKPKRQYFVEQIGLIWRLGNRHSSFGYAPHRNRLHHPPTDDSIRAVASFVTDPSHFVRHAVAKALSSHPDAANVSLPEFTVLVADSDASVRIAAADGLKNVAISPADAVQLLPFLSDSIWSVRWGVAVALVESPYRNAAWHAMKTSLPVNPHFLDSWAWHARHFENELCSDKETTAKLKECVANCGRSSSLGYTTKELLFAIQRSNGSG